MKIFHFDSPSFEETLRKLEDRGGADLERVTPTVRAVIARVRAEGDAALRALALAYDGVAPDRLVYGPEAMSEALDRMARGEPEVLAAMRAAASRIEAFHERQREVSHRFVDAEGVSLGWRVRPLRRVGVYAPGGKARYPSSVLMSAIPARVAGVAEVLVATPRPTDELLAAAALSGAAAVYDMGGAQAIAAFAWGTATVPRVDKIVGPGNLYVACAKQLVFGQVAIDGIAGPSEILVVADEGANPDVVAADLLSQAEHDEAAYPLLVTLSTATAERVCAALEAQLGLLPREAIARESVSTRGAAFVCRSGDHAAEVSSRLAAEHLSLQVRDPEAFFAKVSAAGAVFLGDYTPEAAGDYLAGPSHVLPTGGAVRFASPLGVYDFTVRTSVIGYSPEALRRHQKAITDFARKEGLEGHARAVEVRLGAHSEISTT